MKSWSKATAVGSRERNEDRVVIGANGAPGEVSGHLVAVVPDGLGGHAHGEIASDAAARAFGAAYADKLDAVPQGARMRYALHEANAATNKRSNRSPGDALGEISLPDKPNRLREADVVIVASDGLDSLPREDLAQIPGARLEDGTTAGTGSQVPAGAKSTREQRPQGRPGPAAPPRDRNGQATSADGPKARRHRTKTDRGAP